MSRLNPCAIWDEHKVREYLESNGNPNVYVSFYWQCQHDLFQLTTVCPCLVCFGCFVSSLGFCFAPCFWCEEKHLIVAGPIAEFEFAKQNPSYMSKERAQSTLVGARLLLDHGTDVNLPATRGWCCNEGRTLISAYPQLNDVKQIGPERVPQLTVALSPPKSTKSGNSSAASVSTIKSNRSKTKATTSGASSPETMHRNPEAERWDRRIKQYQSMNAMNGIIMPESVVAQMFNDFTFKEIYDKVANENKLMVPGSWKDDYANNIELGYIPEDVKLGHLALSDPAMAVDRHPVDGAFENSGKKESKHNMKKSFARGIAEEAGRQAVKEGISTATGCNVM